MSNLADCVHWNNIIGKPNTASPIDDIGELKAAGYRKNDVGVWNGKKFIPIPRTALVDTGGVYSPSNKPYSLISISWSPGTVMSLNYTQQTFDLSGVASGFPVMLGTPSILEGCQLSQEVDLDQIRLTIYNPTPYDVVFGDLTINIIVLK